MHRFIKLTGLLLCIALFTQAFANTGVFNGAGSKVMPIKNSQVQLKQEEVLITLSIPEGSGKYGVPFIPKANVKADFHLYNTTKKPIRLQLGFPFFEDAPLSLKDLNFQVQSEEKSYTPKMKKGLVSKSLDPNGLFKKVLTWNDTFKPHALKSIHVSYDLSLSIHLMDTSKLATFGTSYTFIYITKTAYTWLQPVEKAVFTVDVSALSAQLKSYLRETNSFDVLSKDLLAAKYAPIVYLKYEGEGDFADNILTLAYKDIVPKEDIDFSIDVILLPALRKDLEPFLEDLPLIYEQAMKSRFSKESYDERGILTNLLNFYTGLYQGKMKERLWNDFDLLYGIIPMKPEEKKIALEKEYTVHFLLEDDREEVAQIIDYLKEKLQENA